MFKWLTPTLAPLVALTALIALTVTPANALVLDRLPFQYDGAAAYEWRGSICERDVLPAIEDRDIRLRINTSGGYLTNLPALKTSIDELARNHRVTVVFGQCGSACIRLLAHANKLARAGVISLEVERGETAGFHGVSVGGKYDREGTLDSIRDLINEGMSKKWLRDHAQYFELFAGTIQTLAYESDELRTAGLIDAAQIVEAGEYQSMRSENEPVDSIDTSSGTCPKDSGSL